MTKLSNLNEAWELSNRLRDARKRRSELGVDLRQWAVQATIQIRLPGESSQCVKIDVEEALRIARTANAIEIAGLIEQLRVLGVTDVE